MGKGKRSIGEMEGREREREREKENSTQIEMFN
jgi:hypothetical protein